jgi:hypothetical protein
MCNGMEITCSAATAKDMRMITNHDLGRDIIYDMANGRKNTQMERQSEHRMTASINYTYHNDMVDTAQILGSIMYNI